MSIDGPAGCAGTAGEGGRAAAIDVGLMRLCGRDLAIRAGSIREVVPLPDTLHADFSGTGIGAGTVVIRGRAIPVLDIARQLGFARPAGLTGVVVVLREEDRLVGLVMDMVSGLARIAGDQIQALTITGTTPGTAPGTIAGAIADEGHRPLVASGFLYGEALFGLIDQAAVFALPGVTCATEAGTGGQRAAQARGAVVLVAVADTQIAVDTGFVVATVPGDTIAPSPEPGGPWMGVVRYLDREVPVVDDLALFGLTGRAAEGRGGAVVIVHFDDDRMPGQMLGLKIDRIRRILPLGQRSLHPLSGELRARLPLFSGAVVDHEGRQSLMLDHDAVRGDARLRTIAALTRRLRTGSPGGPGGAQAGAPPAGKPKAGGPQAGGPLAYVVFRAGGTHGAASLASIKQIVPVPADTTPVRQAGSALCGIASYDGTPLPLFDLAGTPCGEGAGTPCGEGTAGRMILVVGSEGAYNGIIVDRLETIARTVPVPRPAAAAGHFIHAQVDGRSMAVTVCDLAGQVRRLATGGDGRNDPRTDHHLALRF